MKCPHCGYENKEGAQYCNLCQTSFVKAEPEPGIYQRSGDLPPVSKRPKTKRPLFFYHTVRIGLLVFVLLIVAVFLFEMALLFLPNNLDSAEADCLAVDNLTFQWAVLESPKPVLVVFCPEVLWHRVNWEYVPEIKFFRQPLPTILAVRSIIKGGEYEHKVQFYKYYLSSYELDEDPVAAEYGIKDLPMTILFQNGAVIERFCGTCCTSTDRREEIDIALRTVLKGDTY